MQRRLVLLLLAALAAPLPARAVYLSEDGQTAYLRGEIEEGDGAAFEKFVARRRAAPLKVIYLDSPGGIIRDGMLIALLVRKAGLDTAVKARTTECNSSCTLIFAGGVRRYNIGGDKIQSGLEGFTGLGYHPASTQGDAVKFSLRSQGGTDAMGKFFALMGQPGAAKFLARGASIDTVYRPSGKETLEQRVATSLSEP